MRKSGCKNLSSRAKKSLFLILIGFSFFAVAGFLKGYQEFQQKSLSFSAAPKFIEKVEEGDLPNRIIIPKVSIDLPVFPGKVVDDKWEIAKEGVSYLLGTGIPGRKGNTVIYGHNKRNQFGPIRWLGKGNEIKVTNKKGKEFIYKVTETKIVSPQNIEILSSTQDSTLTLYTCTGFLDRERFIVIAKLMDSTPGVDSY